MLNVQAPWDTLHDNVQDVAHHAPCGQQDQDGKDKGAEGVGDLPLGLDPDQDGSLQQTTSGSEAGPEKIRPRAKLGPPMLRADSIQMHGAYRKVLQDSTTAGNAERGCTVCSEADTSIRQAKACTNPLMQQGAL